MESIAPQITDAVNHARVYVLAMDLICPCLAHIFTGRAIYLYSVAGRHQEVSSRTTKYSHKRLLSIGNLPAESDFKAAQSLGK